MTTPATDRPEPVLDAATLAARVSASVVGVGAIFVIVGWATAEQVQAWAVVAGGVVTSIGALLAYVLPLITAKGARAQVTPLASPVGVDGKPLIAKPPAVQFVSLPPPSAPASQPAPAPAPAASSIPDDLDVTQALARLDAIDGQPADAPTPTYDAVAADLAKQPQPLDDHTRPMQAVANGTPAPTAQTGA